MSTRGGRPTRDQAADIDARIREAALVTFGERGFAGTSMEHVARAARVSKPTLYARYPDKQTLFSAVVTWALSQGPVDEAPSTAVEGDLLDILTAIALALQARAADPHIASLLRITVGESGPFPELAMRAENFAESPRLRHAAEVLRHHAELGTIADPERAVEHFTALFGMQPVFFAAVGMRHRIVRSESELRGSVRMFLEGARR